MSEPTTHITLLDVDEVWLREWAAEGIVALERYLAKHAAFTEWLCARNHLQSVDGDGAGAV